MRGDLDRCLLLAASGREGLHAWRASNAHEVTLVEKSNGKFCLLLPHGDVVPVGGLFTCALILYRNAERTDLLAVLCVAHLWLRRHTQPDQ